MAPVGLSSTITSSDSERTLARYRSQVIFHRTVVQPTLFVLDWVWRGIVFVFVSLVVGGVAVNAALALITTGTIGLSDPRTWAVAQPVLQDPQDSMIAVGGALIVSAIAIWGHQARGRIVPPDLQMFHVGRISSTNPRDFIRNFNQFYVRRRLDRLASAGAVSASVDGSADEAAAAALDRAKGRKVRQASLDLSGTLDKIGICVQGEPMLGTTRLAWQAAADRLRTWTFLAWPDNVPLDKWDRLFRILQRRGARLVLWLDNLGKYTNSPGMVQYINALPTWIEAHGIRFVIVATCHEQDVMGPIHQQFAPLLQRLETIAPERITLEEARQLANAMSRSGQLGAFDERLFDGLPGSVVLGVSRMRNEVYPRLGQVGQLVLKTIKLLRSAGITEYTWQRVIVVGSDVFHLHPDQVPDGIEIVRRTGFLILGSPTPDGQPTVVPATDFYLDVAVPDYPQRSDATPDWPALQDSLNRINDRRALARLADAFREQADFARAEQCYGLALPAFSRADAPLEWADIQYGLGLVLAQRALESQEPERTPLLERAQDCFTRVLAVVNRQNNPAMWVGAMEAWREVLRRETKTTGTPSRIESIEKALASARKEADSAPSDNLAARTQALINVGVLQLLQARLDQYGKSRWHKFNRTIATLEQVISQLPPDGDPTIWARAQSTLGDACVGRAESAGPELKPGFLARAVAAYEAAADKRDDQRTVHEDAQLRLQLGTTLNELAGLSNTSERRDLLRRATNELRAAAREFGKKQYSIERAETQVVLARVFGQLADLAEGTDRVDALTQAIIEFEDAIGVLDPEGVVRGDEIRAEIARLLWRRRLARVQLGESSEATMDAARVVTHCDIVLDHEGTKQRNPSLYQELMGLRREASLGTASRSPVTVSSQVISPGPDTGPK